MYKIEYKDPLYKIQDGEDTIISLTKKTSAEQLLDMFNAAYKKGRSTYKKDLSQVDKMVKAGYVLVDEAQPIHRELSMLRPGEDFFFYVIDLPSRKLYYDLYGSIIMERST